MCVWKQSAEHFTACMASLTLSPGISCIVYWNSFVSFWDRCNKSVIRVCGGRLTTLATAVDQTRYWPPVQILEGALLKRMYKTVHCARHADISQHILRKRLTTHSAELSKIYHQDPLYHILLTRSMHVQWRHLVLLLSSRWEKTTKNQSEIINPQILKTTKLMVRLLRVSATAKISCFVLSNEAPCCLWCLLKLF